jgi:hypothetical protein
VAGYDQLWTTDFGAGYGYYDVADAGVSGAGEEHTHFLVWLIVFALAATALLGGFKAWGFHFVVKV